MQTSEAHRAIQAVWRIDSARLIAGLTRLVHGVGRAGEREARACETGAVR